MIVLTGDDLNPYLALAKIEWSNGQDGEVIARQLARAFAEITKDGAGPDVDLCKELNRLLGEGQTPGDPS